MKVVLDNGKYEVAFEEGSGRLEAKRYGEPWRSLTGDNLVYHMLCRIHELESAAAGRTEDSSGPVSEGLSTC